MKVKKKLLGLLIFLIAGFFLGFYQPIQVNAETKPHFSFSLAHTPPGSSFPHELYTDIGGALDDAKKEQGELVDLIINFDSAGKKIKGVFHFVFYYDAKKMSQTYCSETDFSSTKCVVFDQEVDNYLKNWKKKLEILPDGRVKISMHLELTDKVDFPQHFGDDKKNGSYLFLTIQGMQIKNDAKGELKFEWDRKETYTNWGDFNVNDKTYTIKTTGEIKPPVKLDMPNLSCETTDSGVKWSWEPVDDGVNYLLYVYGINTDEKPLGSEGKWFTTTKEAIAGKTPDVKYQGHINAYDADKNPESKSSTNSKSCKMPAEPVVVESPVTIAPSKATLKFGVRMPDISVDSVETVLVKISDFADQKITLTKKENDYFISSLQFENFPQERTFSIYVKKENVTIGRKFNNITLKPGDYLDCTASFSNCGDLLNSKDNNKTLFSGDADNDKGNDVDYEDFNELVKFYEKSGQPADFNLDGKTDYYDFTILVKNYEKSGDQF